MKLIKESRYLRTSGDPYLSTPRGRPITLERRREMLSILTMLLGWITLIAEIWYDAPPSAIPVVFFCTAAVLWRIDQLDKNE